MTVFLLINNHFFSLNKKNMLTMVCLTREGPQVCPGDFNENDVGLLSQVYLCQV
jgi:hypothetical protein